MGLLLVAAAGAVRAQDASTVPPSSPVYRRIEEISAFFPVPVHLGLRPASRRAVLGMVDKLEREVDAGLSPRCTGTGKNALMASIRR